MGDLTLHFSSAEFACRCGRSECPYSDGSMIHLPLVWKLEEVRTLYGKPLHITSGLRCTEYNKQVGGKPDSAHLKGLAADILCTTSRERGQLLRIVLIHFNRIGIARNFIHVDMDREKPQDVVWVY